MFFADIKLFSLTLRLQLRRVRGGRGSVSEISIITTLE